MHEDLEKSLFLARREKELAQRLEGKLEFTIQLLKKAHEKSIELAEILGKEKKDVDKLERLSLTGLFAAVLGTKEKKLEKERQEYLGAKLKYDASQKLIHELKKEISMLEEQMSLLQNIEEKYQQLLKKKEEVLKTKQGTASRELFIIAEEEGKLASRGKELQEAEEAAQKVMQSLGDLLGTLNSAANWGVWDMLGGGLISTAIKHSKIDDAREQIIVVQQNLNWLERELTDIKIYTDLGIDIGALASFADYFFDGLIADWVVQSRINEAEKRTQELQGQVEVIWHSVKSQLNEITKKASKLIQDKRLLIEQSTIYNS
ncbi:MAG: hypothetical protein PHT78_10205 [Desulfitobacteriaceae bacterium]|nr:hypothetical protein [Desulfitobacteriaceae bacterium]MDD4753599.1 hypothetical protein [Desulfitobacteriaceae bacterium]